MDLLKQEEELQREARDLLRETGIQEFLSKFGEIEIGGSLDSGLMVWRDIDMGVISSELNEENYWQMVKFLYGLNNYYHSLYIQDFRESVNPASPKGLYIGLKIKYQEKFWKVDVWYVKPRKDPNENFNIWLKKNLNDQNKKTILEIKNLVYEDPGYRKEFFSIDIYKAVIDEGVKTLDEFRKYLEKQGKSLSS